MAFLGGFVSLSDLTLRGVNSTIRAIIIIIIIISLLSLHLVLHVRPPTDWRLSLVVANTKGPDRQTDTHTDELPSPRGWQARGWLAGVPRPSSSSCVRAETEEKALQRGSPSLPPISRLDSSRPSCDDRLARPTR
eukprot:GHVU01107483.1.p1 GENE.GHVU01107483.1~~GHVU01107483.1.p1  ORF type:complete len:135 (-),score=14.54 GHVU01107483.1:281-685(-)